MKTIMFDLDGTLADFYGVPNWKDCLDNKDPYPYLTARPLCNLSTLARMLNQLQAKGYRIGIVSWLSKNGESYFDQQVRKAKRKWLAYHMPSVVWDEFHIVKYGTPKQFVVQDKYGILFDDEEYNRTHWKGQAYEPNEIFTVLKSLI